MFSSPSGPSVGRMQYAPTVGYVRPFKKLSRFRLLRGRLWGVCDTPLRPGMCDPSKYRCDPPTGYVRGFKKWICIRHRRWRMVGRMRYAPTTGYVRSFEIPIRFPNRIRAILRKTTPFSSPSGPLVGRIQYAPTTGYVRPFKKLSRFCPLRGRLVGRIQYAPTIGYVRPFKKLSCFCPLRGRWVGRMQYAPTAGYMRSFEIPMQFSNWVRAILRNTDAIPRSDTCDSSKYRYDLSTGGEGAFGRWGGGGYRLRGRRA